MDYTIRPYKPGEEEYVAQAGREMSCGNKPRSV